MHKKLWMFLSFALTVAILIVALKVINWIPVAIQKDEIRRYRDIEEVKSKLKIKDIYVPAYFPEYFSWPPSEIWAQKKPFPAVIMHFIYKDRRDIALIIAQTYSKSDFSAQFKIKPLHIKERVRLSIKGRDGELVLGLCENNVPCTQVSWIEGAYRLNVIGKYPPIELIKIAESMLD
ncbi:MAG: hypothetical protein AB1488_06880 [Nitrospirota bacterium]